MDFFGDLYADIRLDTRGDETGAEVALVLDRLAPEPRVLDVASGRGRTAIALAARGASVTACDLNPDYLEEATRRAEVAGVALDVRRLDYRALTFKREFDAVVSFFASFGYHDDATNADVLRRMAAALVDGGLLVLELQNRDYDLGPRERVATHPDRPGFQAIVESTFDLATSVRSTRYRYVMDGEVRGEGTLAIRMYSLHELRALCAQCGLVVEDVFGSIRGDSFTATSKQIVLLARRKAESS